MTVKEFLEKHNGGPYEFYEVAELLTRIKDNEEIVNAASAFLDTKKNLEMILDEIGFGFG